MTQRETVACSAILVTWNSGAILRACLTSLSQASPGPAELVVVDNASTDGSADLVEEVADTLGTSVSLVRNLHNAGFSAAVNQAIAIGKQPHVLLLNPDVRLLPETIGRLHDVLAAAPPDVAGATGKLLRASGDTLAPTNVIDSTGMVMTRNGRHLDRGAGEVDHGQYDESGEVFGLTGALAMYRRDILERSKIGGEILDEDFFAFREDADLAWRLRGFGYRLLYEASALAYHRRNVTPEQRRNLSPAVNYHSVKNRFLLRIHHADAGWLLHCGIQSYLRDLAVVGACLTVERSSLPAFWWLVRNLPRHMARRGEIMRRRSVDSPALRRWFT